MRYAKSLYSGIAKKMIIIQGYQKNPHSSLHPSHDPGLHCTALAPVRPLSCFGSSRTKVSEFGPNLAIDAHDGKARNANQQKLACFKYKADYLTCSLYGLARFAPSSHAHAIQHRHLQPPVTKSENIRLINWQFRPSVTMLLSSSLGR